MIPINDLKRQIESIKTEIDYAIGRVTASGWYILGPEVENFEEEFASYCQTAHCVGVANGTDALEIGLRSLGISAGDEVMTVANAGMYSTTAILAIGAKPVFIDVDPGTLTLDPKALADKITSRTSAVVVTHLYGRMARMREILPIVRQHGLALVEDCAQAHGAQIANRKAGSWGNLGCFSFYPTKNLGALGDGGAIVTSDPQIAQRARMLRQYGWESKYTSLISGGRNSRLDEIQAAVLSIKLSHLNDWNKARSSVAAYYQKALADTGLQLPPTGDYGEMIYHLYVVRSLERDCLMRSLRQEGIGCDIHYPIPDHLQLVCADLGLQVGYLPVTELAARQVLTLPCFPELRPEEIDVIVYRIKKNL